MDWLWTERIDRFTFEQIDPMDLGFVRAELGGVILAGSRITQGYYTDTRVSAILEVVDADCIENSMVRIHHHVDAWDYHAELGTFFVTGSDLTYERGVWTGTLELSSALYGMSVDTWPYHYAVPAGTYAKAALSDTFSRCMRPHEVRATVRDTRIGTALVYPFGDNCLSTAFDIADICNARLGVDGHGVVTADGYVPPASKSPSFELDLNDGSIIGGVSRADNSRTAPGRVSVIYKNGDVELYAAADAPASSPASSGRRGYMRVSMHNLSEMSPETQWQAQAIASAKLAEESGEEIEFKLISRYFPVSQGDVGLLVLDGREYKVLVKTLEHSLAYGMPMETVLKVV